MSTKPADPKNAPFFVDREVIVLSRNGIWLADGVEITHEPTRRLFAKSLRKREDGKYYLSVGRETKDINVEDTAFFVIRIEGSIDQGLTVFLNDETHEKLDPGTLKYRPGRLVCTVKTNEEAKFLHAPYFDLLKNLNEDSEGYFLKIGNSNVRLARK
jgi:hypothetical protein